jgi:hypothetical protein
LPWSSEFDDLIVLPNGRKLATLKDAANYVIKPPKAEHDAPEGQAAMEALILVAEKGGPTRFARIGVMRALNRDVETVVHSGPKKISEQCADATLREAQRNRDHGVSDVKEEVD